MPPYDCQPKWGPYPYEKLMKIKKEYESYINKHKGKIGFCQCARLENIVKTIGLAISNQQKEITPGYLAKKLKVSEVIAKSYLNVIHIETSSKKC